MAKREKAPQPKGSMKTLQECKDDIAKRKGYKSFLEMELNGFGIGTGELFGYADEAAKLFAQEACREQREICAEHAEVYYPASNNLNPTIDPKSIKNAPEPTLS